MDLQFVLGQRAKPQLVYKDFLLSHDGNRRNSLEHSTYRCRTYGCNARVVINGETDSLKKSIVIITSQIVQK